MKKLNLKTLGLGKDDLLQREQLKTISGGDNGTGCITVPSCDFQCPDDCPVCYPIGGIGICIVA